MAFFRNYSSETNSDSVLEGKEEVQGIGRMVGNDYTDGTSSERGFHINLGAQYDTNGEPDDAGRMQDDMATDNGLSVSNVHLQPPARRNVSGKWGSSFWKDCQPSTQGPSDSGPDSKSDYKHFAGSEDNMSDGLDGRIESEDEGHKDVVKGQKGHADVPADEMLSDEYYEQDGEDQSDSVHYSRGLSHSAGFNSRLQSKPSHGNKNFSRSLRSSNKHEDDDDDNNDDGDADYEEEEEDEDDPDDADFDPDYGGTSGHAGSKDKDWEAGDSDDDDNSVGDLEVSDEDSYYVKKPKGWQHGKGGGRNTKVSGESKSLHTGRQKRGKASFEEEYSSEESDSNSDSDEEELKSMSRRRKSNARSTMSANIGGTNNEVRTSSRSVRKVSYVESDESEDIDEGKKKKVPTATLR